MSGINFCSRCGQQLGNPASIHTCTPPAARKTLGDTEQNALQLALDALRLPVDRWNKVQSMQVNAAIAACDTALGSHLTERRGKEVIANLFKICDKCKDATAPEGGVQMSSTRWICCCCWRSKARKNRGAQ